MTYEKSVSGDDQQDSSSGGVRNSHPCLQQDGRERGEMLLTRQDEVLIQPGLFRLADKEFSISVGKFNQLVGEINIGNTFNRFIE